MKGYYFEEVNVIGMESWISFFIWIFWDCDIYMYNEVKGFFLVGEGVGYVGGIIFVVMDG